MKSNYKTSQRTAIIEFLMNNIENFVSAEDIKKYLDNKKLDVGLTTIYRQSRWGSPQGCPIFFKKIKQ